MRFSSVLIVVSWLAGAGRGWQEATGVYLIITQQSSLLPSLRPKMKHLSPGLSVLVIHQPGIAQSSINSTAASLLLHNEKTFHAVDCSSGDLAPGLVS